MRIVINLLIAIFIAMSCSSKSKYEVQFTNQQGIVSVIQLDVILDPFCEMNVKETHCHDTTTYKSLRYGFCSSVCKEAFLKDPNMYIK